MKKTIAILLTTALILGTANMAFANNGKGKGLATAPGQAENFSKGITTLVTTDNVVTTSQEAAVETSSDVTVEPKRAIAITENVSEAQVRVNHPQQKDWYRYDTVITTETITTTSTWDEITTVTTTTTTVTPITTTDTVVTTVNHRGAPGSDGEVISKTSEITNSVSTSGTPVVTTETDTVVTTGEVSIATVSQISSETVAGSGWIKP